MVDDFFQISEDNLSRFGEWCEKYPASSVTRFFYAKMLSSLNPAAYNTEKAKLLLYVLNRRKYIDYELRENGCDEEVRSPRTDLVDSSIQEGDGSQEHLISHLIQTLGSDAPKIKFDPEKHDATVNYSKSSLVEDPEIVSETLAKFYLAQGYVSKAIKIYKKLCLHFPEKSCYFAAQIGEIKKSIKN